VYVTEDIHPVELEQLQVVDEDKAQGFLIAVRNEEAAAAG